MDSVAASTSTAAVVPTNPETSGNTESTPTPTPAAAEDSLTSDAETSPSLIDTSNELNAEVEVQKLDGQIAALQCQLEEVNNDDPNVVIRKLKSNIQIIIDKMNEICKVNSVMLEKIHQLTSDNDDLYDNQYNMKVEVTELNQYGRRENVEFCNIPETIEQNSLEKHIITVMQSLDIKVSSYQIVGVHRIGKRSRVKPRNVIVRFVNRKNAFTLLKRKKQLKSGIYKNYFIIENLCPTNKQLFNALYKRKKNKELHSLWTFNGQVFLKLEEDSDRQQVKHFDDIDDIFAEHSDTSSNYEEDGGFGFSGSNGSQWGSKDGLDSSSNNVSRSQKRRSRLSDIAEEPNDSILRTPIPPLRIKI